MASTSADGWGLRAALLAHFQEKAVPSGEFDVLSDVDDTFYEHYTDKRYPQKTVFPGVRVL